VRRINPGNEEVSRSSGPPAPTPGSVVHLRTVRGSRSRPASSCGRELQRTRGRDIGNELR
jgi:hypothetical protein